MTDVKLSFCIPTYNRAAYIEQTIESIADQITELRLTDSVEICISDNASIDETDQLVYHFKQRYPSIKVIYSKNDYNIGADLNYLRAVELASGEYCWFMGSDDVLKPNSLNTIFDKLKVKSSIYLCNRTFCDSSLNPISDQKWLKSYVRDEVFKIYDRKSFANYVDQCTSLGGLFSYLSSIIFKRSKWNSIPYDERFTGTAYAHVFKLFQFLIDGCTLNYISSPLVYCRGDNDSFLGKSLAKRVNLDLYGYLLLANTLFSKEEIIHSSLLKVLNSECNNAYFYSIRSTLKVRCFSEKEDWRNLKSQYESICGDNLKFLFVDKIPFALLFLFRMCFVLKRIIYV
ncbi:glycosyltransferase [Geotalea daltonii FRC-32]|uniref:Glycosyltransferase n=1 Tax=Geotalea daltonii (strain DSM 22248 / JCM 15807 / FRC-32) TaxID=316067 RepID=B9M8Y8_GEODF|nr:glycosyltransferase family 2 protein [Geotalea daltonii]ACM20484.1 glycosyltransferase [Geotalea daltonii FRC-32]